jgi:hypothetical protein
MLFLERDNAFHEWNGEMIDSVRHPLTIEQIWSDDELAVVNLYRPVDPGVPAGKAIVNRLVSRVNGVVTYVYTLQDVAAPDLNRIQFEFMVEKLGLASAIETALALMPDSTEAEQNAKIMARVLYRSGQKFERSHYLFTTLAPAVGLTTEQVDAAWTQALTV